MRAWFAAGVAAVLAIIAVVVWRSGKAEASLTGAQSAAVVANVTAAPPAAAEQRVRRARAIAPDAPEPDARSIEERRFARYDKDRSGSITREEYLANRKKNFEKLDANHDGKLSFEEYATKAEIKFDTADIDHKGRLTPAEFATTATKHRARTACPPVEAVAQGDA